jgi:hypothetical protein
MDAPGRALAALFGLVLLSLPGDGAQADDRHAGYYYPPPQSEETYKARAQPMADTTRAQRIGWVVGMTELALQNPYPPAFHIFAKGEDAEKMIVTSVNAQMYNTLFRMRALMAALTAKARTLPVFQDFGVEDYFTFFDLAMMLGFKQITLTDGDTFAHQIFLR